MQTYVVLGYFRGGGHHDKCVPYGVSRGRKEWQSKFLGPPVAVPMRS